METKNAGLFANLFYYNENAALDETSDTNADEDISESGEKDTQTDEEKSDAWNPWWIIVIGVVVIVIGLGVFLVMKKRKTRL